jgi:hypothetical protein
MAAFSRRITAGRRPSSGPGRPPLGGGHAQRAQDAGQCKVFGQPVFFSASKSICFSPSPPPQLLLERAAAAFRGPAARSRPFDPACRVKQLSIRCLARVLPARRRVVAGAQDEGKGEGRRGRHHHRVLRHHLGDARRPLSAPCRAQQAVRPSRCAVKCTGWSVLACGQRRWTGCYTRWRSCRR